MHEESAPRNRHQASAKPNCAHKQLKKQMVGEQLWYACECGQKFRIEAWDGKVSVLAPPDPRKDLAALENAIGWAESGKVPVKAVVDSWREALAEMRGAKR